MVRGRKTFSTAAQEKLIAHTFLTIFAINVLSSFFFKLHPHGMVASRDRADIGGCGVYGAARAEKISAISRFRFWVSRVTTVKHTYSSMQISVQIFDLSYEKSNFCTSISVEGISKSMQ